LQTVWMQVLKKDMASTGAERQAQFSVTSSHPEESARPIGMRQSGHRVSCDSTINVVLGESSKMALLGRAEL
jgi:hypothetical protein